MSGGLVSESGASFLVTLDEDYVLDKINVYYSDSTSSKFSSLNFSLTGGVEVSNIDVLVVSIVDAYNKPITIDVSDLKYGLKTSDIAATPNDNDLVFQGLNLFNTDEYYSLTSSASGIYEPGPYTLLLVYDSVTYGHFPGDETHYYINSVSIDGASNIYKETVCEYSLANGTKGHHMSDDSQNKYLYILAHYVVPGLTLEYIPNAGDDSVTNMPDNEIKEYVEDEPINISSTIPVREGYSFVGWSLTSDGNVITSTKMPAGGLKLYAIWQNNVVSVPRVETKVPANDPPVYVPVHTCVKNW